MAGRQASLFDKQNPAPVVDKEKASRTFPALSSVYPESIAPAYDLGTFQSAAEQSGFVFAALMRLAGVAASIRPLVVKRGTRDEKAPGRLAEHVRRVLGNVNPETTYPDWIEDQVMRLGMTGEVLNEKVRNGMMGPKGRRMVAELHNHNPERMRPLSDPTGRRKVRGYEILIGGKSILLRAEDAIFTRYTHPRNDYRGLSPVAPMEKDIAADMAASLHNLRLIRNGVRSGGIFTPQEGYEWTAEHTAQFNAQVQQHNAGPNNAGRFLFIPQAGKFFPDGQSLRDMDYPGLRRLAREIIAGVIGTPPVVIGNFDSASYANSEAQLRAFWEYVGIPLLTKLFGALNEHWVHPELDDTIEIRPDFAQIEAMIEAPGTRSERGTKLFVQGVATQNEARAMAGLPPVPGGDIFAFPVNVIPVSATEAPEEVLREDPEPIPMEDAAAFDTFAIKAPLTREERMAALALHEKGLQRAERLIATRTRGALFSQRRRLEKRFHDGITPEELFPTPAEALALYRDIEPAVLQVIKAGAEEALARLGHDNRGVGIWTRKAGAPGGADEVFARFDATNMQVSEWLESFAADQVLKITDTTYKALLREFEIVRRSGRGPGDLFAQLRKMPEFGDIRAAAIARTESIGATNFGTHEGLRAAGVELKSWLSARDGARVRHSHQKADIDSHQHPIRISEKFQLSDPKRGITEAAFPGDTRAAAWARINCFVPETSVSGAFVGGLKATYAGTIREIKTRRGHRLRVTPNHPILTSKGWLPAKEITQGSDLFSYSGNVQSLGFTPRAGDEDGKDGPATIHQVFETIGSDGASRLSMAGALDLHGDGRFCDSEVDVVRALSHLGIGAQAQTSTFSDDLSLEPELTVSSGRVGFGSSASFCDGDSPAGAGLPCRRTLSLYSGSVVLDAGPLHALRLGPAADVDAASDELSRNRFATEPEFVSQLLEASAGLITPDHVIEVRDVDYAGHVYDLEAVGGWMLADGVVASNCRCAVQPEEEERREYWMRGAREVLAN